MSSPSSVPPSGIGTVGRGIGFMLAAVLVFSILNVVVKWASARFPVAEIAFFRNFLALIPTLVLVATNGGFALLRTRHPFAHLFRGGIGVVSMLLIFYALKALPVADATAISFAAPLFMTALSVPLLDENVGVYRWSAVLVGFAGVLVITRPGHDLFNWGAASAVTSAFTYAIAMISVRQMSRTEHPVTIIFYFHVIGALSMSTTLPFVWITPDLFSFAILIVMGLCGGIGQYFQTQAFRLAPAAVAAPFNYLSIVITGFLGYLIWNEVPEAHVVFGSIIVIVSGLFIIYRETVRRRQAEAPVALKSGRPGAT